ncbi:hypothetical protein Pan216_03550 [Planctomycetes bacterium Pan216]|uniref:Uncharacterized protein n=1 Tax=Kolteria novifilia TaxID=2527975 RepID=A0A518AXR9_9BACT|nr:hypothetical protein Pan216_03550 [Planctomycetes bacterium Pan216]
MSRPTLGERRFRRVALSLLGGLGGVVVAWGIGCASPDTVTQPYVFPAYPVLNLPPAEQATKPVRPLERQPMVAPKPMTAPTQKTPPILRPVPSDSGRKF